MRRGPPTKLGTSLAGSLVQPLRGGAVVAHRAPILAASIAAFLALTPHVASAQAPPAAGNTRAHAQNEGTVVAVDGTDFVVDLGTGRGLREGDVVELWRPVRLKHPITGQALVDRFRIGSMRLVQVQSTLSIARLDGEPRKPPQAGDVVVFAETAAPPPPAAAPSPTPQPTAQAKKIEAPDTRAQSSVVVPQDPDARALADLFVALEGTDPNARANAYLAFIGSHPKTRYAKVLREEVAALRTERKKDAPPEYEMSQTPLERARPGVAQRYAVELDPRFTGAVLHVRRKGSPAFRSISMASAGPRYWSAVLPGDAIAEPGLEYFVEGVPDTGHAVAVIGTAQEPRDVDVDPLPITGKQPGTLAQVNIQSEYASFNAKKANDYVWQTEGAVGWRLHDVGVRAVRSGFGVLRGKGGTLTDLDEKGADPKDIGLTYGWIELEVAFGERYAIIGRPILGLKEGGLAGGAQGFLRLGNDLKTNLLLGGEVLGEIGMRGIVELDWRTIPRVPIVLRTEVTNQPAGVGSDIGARAIVQGGYEITHDFVVAARGSYQGRTINHAGPGAGLAVSYQW
jgi:hypothetical protein